MATTKNYAKSVGVYCLFDTESKNLYEDDSVKVMILMDAGKAKFVVYNKTSQVLFLDKANSFAYTNGQPQTLFTNAAYTTGKNTGSGASVNLGSVAGAIGIGGAVGSLLGGVNVGGGNSVTNTTTVYEQRVIAVAPQSLTVLYEWTPTDNLNKQILEPSFFNLLSPLGKFHNQMSGEKEKFRQGMTKHYTSSFQSPLALKGIVSYSSSERFENAKLANVECYVSDVFIDTYKSLKKKEKSKIDIQQQLANRSYFAFRSGGNIGAFFGILAGTYAVIGGIVYIALL